MAGLVSSLAGALLVLAMLRDLFHTVFHPAGRSGLSSTVFRVVWRLTGKVGSRARTLAGPSAVVLVIALWSIGLIVGWALIYWPRMPESYLFAPGLSAAAQDGFLDALYYSWVTQATLGFGDIVPQTQPLRLLAPLQATIGFALFTLAVSWVLSIYPALHRQRAAAMKLGGICDSREQIDGVIPDAATASQLTRAADAIATCRVDFVQYPATLFFAAPADDLSLAAALPRLTELVSSDTGAQARVAASELKEALDLLASTLAEDLNADAQSTEQALAAFRDHSLP